jgi:hypothetical protein
MTGPEHYRQAEELIAEARKVRRTGGEEASDRFARAITEAQVHAILAVAAASALDSVTDSHGWHEAAGTKPSDSA